MKKILFFLIHKIWIFQFIRTLFRVIDYVLATRFSSKSTYTTCRYSYNIQDTKRAQKVKTFYAVLLLGIRKYLDKLICSLQSKRTFFKTQKTFQKQQFFPQHLIFNWTFISIPVYFIYPPCEMEVNSPIQTFTFSRYCYSKIVFMFIIIIV